MYVQGGAKDEWNVQAAPHFRSLCVGLFVLFSVMPMLLLFVYHSNPTVVGFSLLLVVLISLVPAVVTGQPGLTAGCLAGVLLGSALGLNGYYQHVLPMRALLDLPVYSAVSPEEPAVAYRDASIMHFAKGTIVDDSQAVGMVDVNGGSGTFCVAPIANQFVHGDVKYWAVGMNCCGALRFECDEADDLRVRTGVVVQSPQERSIFFRYFGKYFAPPLMRRDLIEKAVRKAEATHGVQGAEPAIFVQWTSTPPEDIVAGHWLGIAVLLLLQLVWASGAALGLGRWASRAIGTSELLPWGGNKPWEAQPAEGRRGLVALMVHVTIWGFAVPYAALLGCMLVGTDLGCLGTAGVTGPLLGASFWWGAITHVFYAAFIVGCIVMLLAPTGQLYVVFLVAVAATGHHIGHINYNDNMSFYCRAASGREYTGVRPESKAFDYQDAGRLHFAPGSRVGVDWAVGLRFDGEIYCAAPIVGPEQTVGQIPRVDFWAVGLNCCGARGRFVCNQVATGASSGVVVHDAGGPITELASGTETAKLRRAARAAAEHYGLPVSPRPVVLHWGKDLAAIEAEWYHAALGVVLLTTVASLVLLALTSTLALVYAPRRKQ